MSTKKTDSANFFLKRAGQLYAFMLDKNASWLKKLSLILVAMYVISPIDFVPDFIPFWGWLDDMGIVAFAVAAAFRWLDVAEQERTKKDSSE